MYNDLANLVMLGQMSDQIENLIYSPGGGRGGGGG